MIAAMLGLSSLSSVLSSQSVSSTSSSFSLSSTSLHARRYHPVGSIDYGFFDHKTAYQRPKDENDVTRTRTIREAGEEESRGKAIR